MKVLVPLPHDLAPVTQGRNLRMVHLLRELDRLCSLTCLAANDRVADAAAGALPGIHIAVCQKQPPSSRAAVLCGGTPALRRAIGFFGYEPALLTETFARSCGIDAILGFGLQSVAYLLAAKGRRRWHAGAAGRWDQPSKTRPVCAASSDWQGPERRRPEVRTVCDLIDDPWLTWLSLPLVKRSSIAGLKSAVCTQLIRRYVLRSFNELVAVGPRDAELLSRASGREVHIVPNGVITAEQSPQRLNTEPLVVFSGTMDFPPNEAAACYLVHKIWPRVLAALRRDLGPVGINRETNQGKPLARLAIVGANPTARVRRLAQKPGVIVTGFVPDPAVWLERARVAAAPMLSGCGIKNKILEACAAGCPVVATPLGAAGLPIGAQHGIIIAQTPRRFADELARLLTHGDQARAIGRAGWAMVKERYSWPMAARLMLGVLSANHSPIRSPIFTDESGNLSPIDLIPSPRPAEEVLAHAAS